MWAGASGALLVAVGGVVSGLRGGRMEGRGSGDLYSSAPIQDQPQNPERQPPVRLDRPSQFHSAAISPPSLSL